MPAAAAWAAVVIAAYGANEQRESRKEQKTQAAAERARLAAIEAEPPPRLPTRNDQRRSQRRSFSDLARRRGRQSTIYTDSGGQSLGA